LVVREDSTNQANADRLNLPCRKDAMCDFDSHQY
jgi:hypothetical protein